MIAVGALLVGGLVYTVLRPDAPAGAGTARDCPAAARPCSAQGAPPAQSGGSPAPSVPVDARAFVDTIGVNTHLWYGDTPYVDYAMVKRRLMELGVRHIRDGLDPAGTSTFSDRVNDLGAAGIKSTLIACRVEPPGTPWATYAQEARTRVRSALDALEGVNEPDLVAAGQADWAGRARACQGDIYQQARDPAIGRPLAAPVLGPSLQAGNTLIGDISDRADGAAIHPYPGGTPPSGPYHRPVSSHMAEVRRYQFGGAPVPVVATETGYHDALNTTSAHPPVSQRAAAIYVPRLLLEYRRAGVRRTFLYELVDERPDPALGDVEANFGLFEFDWSYKPSAIALKNMIGLLDSPGSASRRPLRYSLAGIADPDGAGTGGAVKDLLLQRSDGSYWLALWQDSKVWDENARRDIANPATPVRVSLGRKMSLTSYRPTQGATGSERGTARSFTVDVGDDVHLIKMTDARTPS